MTPTPLARFCPASLPAGLDLPAEILIAPGARDALPDLVARHVPGMALVLADPDTWRAAGSGAAPGHLHLLTPHPHADDETVDEVRAIIGDDAGGVLAVGSGTINDLAKRACTLAERPFVVFGTAASMNGYASGIAAILSGGLKTTVPASPARAVVLDTDVLAAAPAALTRAGLGDLLSKPVSDSDWWLADQLEGTGYGTLPSQIVDVAVREASAAAAGLATRDPAAHAALGRALVLSGVAMVAAGSSAPASGGEHLVSHLWDMEAHAAGREVRLHGAQVGVATCISAALYQRLLWLDRPRFAEPPPWPEEEARIRREHGALAPVVLDQARRKHARGAARVALLRDRWPEIRDGLAARALPTPAEVRAPLLAAGAPHRLVDLGEGHAAGARVLRLARDIRDRITVLDLAFDLGVFPAAVDDVIADSGV